MIQTVIFDMDGVIIDSEPIHFKIETQLFEKLGINVSLDEHYSYVGTSCRNMWEIIVKKNNLSIDIDELIRINKNLFFKYLTDSTDLEPINGIKEFITELYENNFKLVLASSSSLEVIRSILFKLKLADFFTIQISGEDILYSKPNPEIFLKSARLVKCLPGQCIVFEDSENGVIAAKLAGMKCIGYLNSNSGVQNLNRADLIIKSFKEINADLIKAL